MRFEHARSWRIQNIFGGVALAAGLLLAPLAAARAGGTLTIAMTAGDLPIDIGQPDQGAEGSRFVGYNLYDSLSLWDLSRSDAPSDLVPGLATEWHVDPDNPRRWIYTLRQGVKWHDGCDFTADDVMWNVARVNDTKSPQFNLQQSAVTRTYFVNVASVEKTGPYGIVFNTNFVDSLFPYNFASFLLFSPCRAKQYNYDWTALTEHPSGTGPYVFDRIVQHERMEMLPNTAYWNPKRVPKQDRLVILPMPEASTRVAALLSGAANFIEAPPPDSIPRLKSAGMQIITNVYPHDWPYELNTESGPFKDIRVRRAANYAINRDDMVELLGGVATAEYATIPPNMPYYGHPMRYDFNPDKAHDLLKEAGCLPCRIKIAISTSGSGQMQPLPMNELVKSQLDAVGFEVTFDVMDWNAIITLYREGVGKHPDYDGINDSRNLQDPETTLIKIASKKFWAPAGGNWGHYYSPETEALIDQAMNTFDADSRLAVLTRLHEKLNEDAYMVFIVHDLNPRALAPSVHGFVQAQSWYQDQTPITVSP
jgi:ABC-type transport system substrate-binding protein